MTDAHDDTAAKDAAAKARIMKHLNGDHQLELQRYLQHYAKLSSGRASKPQLIDITHDTLTIATRDGANHTIPWSPPLKSWADARVSAVNMDREAREAMGISDIRVSEYVPPTLAHLLVGVLTTMEYVLLVCYVLGLDGKGTWVDGVVLERWFPGGGGWYRWIQGMTLIPMVLIHTGEALWMDRKVRRHGIERGSKLWWLWVGDNSLEGYGAHYRFDELVKQKEKEKALKKH